MRVIPIEEELKTTTDDFLKENSVYISFKRDIKERTDTGGYTVVGTKHLEPQRFAVIGPTAGLRRAPEVITEVGQVTSYNLSLVGDSDADVRDNDTFELSGGRYRVDFVFPEHSFKTHAIIVYEGSLDESVGRD